jgi:hypothetical protein
MLISVGDADRSGTAATSSILLTAHCVLIVLSRRLIGCPGRNANTTAKDASAAAQRVEQERLWKAAGVTAGPVTGLMILAWIGLVGFSAGNASLHVSNRPYTSPAIEICPPPVRVRSRPPAHRHSTPLYLNPHHVPNLVSLLPVVSPASPTPFRFIRSHEPCEE